MKTAPGWSSHTTVDQDELIAKLESVGVFLEDILQRIAVRAYEDGYEQGQIDKEKE